MTTKHTFLQQTATQCLHISSSKSNNTNKTNNKQQSFLLHQLIKHNIKNTTNTNINNNNSTKSNSNKKNNEVKYIKIQQYTINNMYQILKVISQQYSNINRLQISSCQYYDDNINTCQSIQQQQQQQYQQYECNNTNRRQSHPLKQPLIIYNLNNLQQLILSHNNLIQIPSYPQILINFPNLKLLNLNHNNIKCITNQFIKVITPNNNKLQYLQSVLLYNNGIQSIGENILLLLSSQKNNNNNIFKFQLQQILNQYYNSCNTVIINNNNNNNTSYIICQQLFKCYLCVPSIDNNNFNNNINKTKQQQLLSYQQYINIANNTITNNKLYKLVSSILSSLHQQQQSSIIILLTYIQYIIKYLHIIQQLINLLHIIHQHYKDKNKMDYSTILDKLITIIDNKIQQYNNINNNNNRPQYYETTMYYRLYTLNTHHIVTVMHYYKMKKNRMKQKLQEHINLINIDVLIQFIYDISVNNNSNQQSIMIITNKLQMYINSPLILTIINSLINNPKSLQYLLINIIQLLKNNIHKSIIAVFMLMLLTLNKIQFGLCNKDDQEDKDEDQQNRGNIINLSIIQEMIKLGDWKVIRKMFEVGSDLFQEMLFSRDNSYLSKQNTDSCNNIGNIFVYKDKVSIQWRKNNNKLISKSSPVYKLLKKKQKQYYTKKLHQNNHNHSHFQYPPEYKVPCTFILRNDVHDYTVLQQYQQFQSSYKNKDLKLTVKYRNKQNKFSIAKKIVEQIDINFKNSLKRNNRKGLQVISLAKQKLCKFRRCISTNASMLYTDDRTPLHASQYLSQNANYINDSLLDENEESNKRRESLFY